MIQKRNLLLLSFITGFSVMVIELTAARIIAPILGSSIYTWTSAIGVILLGSSLGNHVGGRLIDKKNEIFIIANFFLAASFCVLFISPLATFATYLILKITILWLSTIFASLLLFFLPAFLLGAVYPMIAKQYLQNITEIGKGSGTLSANWSIGSIVGTFLTGFILIGYIGSDGTLLIISIILFLCSFCLYLSHKTRFLSLFFYLLLIILYIVVNKCTPANASTVFQKESNYYNIRVADEKLPSLGKVRILFLDAGSHNIESISGEKFDSYVNFHPVFSIFNKKINDIAMLGGGSLELSNNFKDYYPNANVVTAEIDPEVTKTAKKYFHTSDYIINNTITADGRMFLAQSPKKYDVIFSDAYSSFISVPWHLTTQEFFQLSKDHLTKEGVFAVNFISAQKGDNSAFYKSMLATFSSIFENYYVFAYGDDPASTENIVLVGLNSIERPANSFVQLQLMDTPGGDKLAHHLITIKDNTENKTAPIILTDNFAPTDRLMLPSINNYFQPYFDFMNPKT